MAIVNKGVAQPPKPKASVAPFGGINPDSPDRSSFPAMYSAELIAVRNGRKTVHVVAPLPENYSFQLATDWGNPFNQPLSNLASVGGNGVAQAANAAVSGATAINGATDQAKWLSGAVWTGGSLFQIDVPFVIQAYEDTKSEVLQVMRDMLKLVAPAESEEGLLRAPGPTAGNAFNFSTTGEEITIRIGEFFTMSPCVIESVNCDFDTQMDNDNHCPLSCTITVTAKSYWTTTKEDLDSFFKNKLP